MPIELLINLPKAPINKGIISIDNPHKIKTNKINMNF